MPLFIDRLPLHRGAITLPILISDQGAVAPSSSAQKLWAFDSGMSGDAFCWRFHLEQAGLDPDEDRLYRLVNVTTAVHFDRPVQLPVRRADIWLVSNIDSFQAAPHKLELAQGIVFRDELPPLFSMTEPRAFVGLRALRRAHLRLEVDFAARVVSVWTPDKKVE